MSATFEHQTDNLYLLKIVGELKKSDLENSQTDFVDYLAEAGAIKLLVLLEDFTGWEPGVEWGENSFFFTHGDYLEKIAIVGDPQWETEVMTFGGAGLRKGHMKYFSPSGESEARAWLSE